MSTCGPDPYKLVRFWNVQPNSIVFRSNLRCMAQPNTLLLRFVDEAAVARVKLQWDQAPATCAGIVDLLPTQGTAHHGIYSGSECVYLLPDVLRLEDENATSDVRKGQVGFTWMAAGSAYGVNADFAEICWFYDLDAKPQMWEGPVTVNLFGEIVEPADDFYAVCYRMRREGCKLLVIEAQSGEEAQP